MVTEQKIAFRIPIFYIEEEQDWIDIIGRIIIKNFNDVDYRFINEKLSNVINLLDQEKGPGILIWDLRLENEFSEYQTVMYLCESLLSMTKKGFKLFILSGYLSDDAKLRLIGAGVPAENIFEKGNFSRTEFIESIRIAEETIHHMSSANCSAPTNETELIHEKGACKISSKFIGFEDDQEPFLINSLVKYSLSINITTLMGIVEIPDLVGKHIDFVCYCKGLRNEVSNTTMVIPDMGRMITKNLDIVFNRDSINIHRNFYLMAYFRNHLIYTSVFSIKVI